MHTEEHAKFCLKLKSRLTRLINSIYTENTYISQVRYRSNACHDSRVEPAGIKLAINYRHQIITLGFNCAHKITSCALLPHAIFPYVKMLFRGRNSYVMTLSMHDVYICNIL